jgi:glycosyltransferase involved in cell wall biosynthesis/predicted O-methyltransferase YrrM
MKAWMDDKEKLLITKHFSSDKVMLEWGSGGSTIEFSPQLKKYYSIEHNKEWYENVKNEISVLGYKNINYNFVPQNLPNNDGRQSEYAQFKDYIDVVDTFDTKFDIVLIDGRARRLCAKKIIPYLNPGAIVIIHDWCVRDVYHCVTDYYDVFEYVNDTPQTIATFKLKEKPLPNAYDLNMSGWERTNENYFKKTNNKMKISLIQPGRNNLKYLKWSYNSIRKNQGIHDVQICVADDASTDGTWDWCLEMMDKDPNFNAIKNEGPERLGHTILYDKLINEVAKHDICMIYHADMYLCPGALDDIEKHLIDKTIVSLTRIEPPLHPPGPEKIIQDFGIEPEEFEEEKLLEFVNSKVPNSNTTGGIFAPWAFWKSDFQEIGGHDEIFAPQSKEDTDIFNRFQLNGIKFIQTWEGFVYHMTCRGSRFADGAKRNPSGEVFMKNRETDEWLKQNQKSTKEFLRKWGHYCKHDAYLKPIVPPKYNVGFVVKNCNLQLLELLEPWCSTFYCDEQFTVGRVSDYVENEDTSFDLYERIKYDGDGKSNDILIEMDGTTLTQEDFGVIQQLSEILKDSGEIGGFELGNLKITINSLTEYQNDLINC